MGLIKALIKLPIFVWILAIGGYLYYTYYTWQTTDFAQLKSSIQETKSQLENLQRQNQAAENFERERDSRIQELQNLATEFNKALEKLPKSSDTPGLLSNLAEISDRVGVEFTRFEPGTSALNGFLMETPFKVELKGTFVQIMSFMDEVAHLKRIVAGKTITFKEPILRGSTAVLTADATLITYYFDENARPSSAPPASSSGQSSSQGGGK